MDLFEELVMWHLTRNGHVFVCPQYAIARGWSCPDFVALDYKEKAVKVVEVSTASWPGGLLEKAKNRKNQWLDKLKEQLQEAKIDDGTWEYKVVLYIRKDAVAKFQEKLGEATDVRIENFEDCGLPWAWAWSSAKARKELEEGQNSPPPK